MSYNSKDKTVEKNLIKQYLFFIEEYEAVKKKKHPRYRFVKEFYQTNGLKKQIFLKFYNRFKKTGKTESLLPQKRGPKFRTK